MKIKSLLSAIVLTVVFTSTNSFGQIGVPKPSPKTSISQVVGLTNFSIEYSRPSTRERKIFGELLPFGKLWRTGANERTKITFDQDIKINGQDIKAGSYAIFTTPNKTDWEIIFYNEPNGWGLPQEFDESKVVLKFNIVSKTTNETVTSFNISFNDLTYDNASIALAWENTTVAFNVEVPTDQLATNNIEKALAGPAAYDYFQAASYYYISGKDLEQAKTWIDKAISMSENAPFWQLRQQALIYKANGDTKEAIKIAKKSLKASEEAGNQDYINLNKKSIEDWSKK